ncbi:MAG: hypothetical protein ACTHNQ_20485 [Microbacterium sp.]|uniref:hypothetical protein n=1 Tax=Microbacterium sp. TaxID=51671 RepID=UPI003F80B8BA
MRTGARAVIASLTATLLFASLTACSRPSSRADSGYGSNDAGQSCSELLAATIQHARTDSGDINSTMEAMRLNCSNESEIAADYLANSFDSEFRVESCDELIGYGTRTEAVELLAQDGWCSFGAAAEAATPQWPNDGLGWDQTHDHVGTVQRVCGPLMSARETEDGTFLNLGSDYPSADRFTIIFWDTYLEPISTGVTLCGSGEIYLYNGVAQMEMWDPAALEIWS